MVEINIKQWPFVRWKHESMSEKALGGTCLGVSIVAGSTYSAFAKQLTKALSARSLLLLSELLTCFFVIFSSGLLPVLRQVTRMPRRTIGWIVVVGIFSETLAPLLIFTGLRYTSAVNASLFGNSEMVFLIFLAFLLLHEEWSRHHVVSSLLIIGGILMIALEGFTQGFIFHLGDILILLSGLAFAIGDIVFRIKLHHIEPHLVIFIRACTAIAAFFLISPFMGQTLLQEVRAFPLSLIPVLLGFVIIARFLNIFTFYEAMDRLNVSTVSLVSSLQVVGGVVFAMMFLGEGLAWYHLVGGALIMLGTVTLELAGLHPSEKHHELHLEQGVMGA